MVVHVHVGWVVWLQEECLLPVLSNQEKSPSHVLHFFTVILPAVFQVCSGESLSLLFDVVSVFLPLVAPLADQIVLSALDSDSHPVSLSLLSYPLPSCPLACCLAPLLLLSVFSCWQTAKGQEAWHVTLAEKKGVARSTSCPLTQWHGKEVMFSVYLYPLMIHKVNYCRWNNNRAKKPKTTGPVIIFCFTSSSFNLLFILTAHLVWFGLCGKESAVVKSLPSNGETLIQHYVDKQRNHCKPVCMWYSLLVGVCLDFGHVYIFVFVVGVEMGLLGWQFFAPNVMNFLLGCEEHLVICTARSDSKHSEHLWVLLPQSCPNTSIVLKHIRESVGRGAA